MRQSKKGTESGFQSAPEAGADNCGRAEAKEAKKAGEKRPARPPPQGARAGRLQVRRQARAAGQAQARAGKGVRAQALPQPKAAAAQPRHAR